MNTSFRIFVAAFASALWPASPAFSAWEKGDAIPNLSEYQLEGTLPSLEGKLTYIDFWASWCAPCKASFPEMERLYLAHKEAGFQVLAVSVDASEKAMSKFLGRAAPTFSVVRDSKQSLVSAAEVEVMPTSFLVDEHGVIRSVHFGWRGGESVGKLQREIVELLEEMNR